MAQPSRQGFFSWLVEWLAPPSTSPDEIEQARRLIRAIDAGGVPLNPARINHIARELGLEVSKKALAEHTIQRIREALNRV